MKFFQPFKRAEKGQSLVELAVSLLVLLLILTAVIEAGRMLFQYITIRDAAQEGVLYASINPSACDQTVQRVRDTLWNMDPSEINVVVQINGVSCATASYPCADRDGTHFAEVTVVQPNYPIAVPFMGTFLGRQTTTLHATVTATIISPSCSTYSP